MVGRRRAGAVPGGGAPGEGPGAAAEEEPARMRLVRIYTRERRATSQAGRTWRRGDLAGAVAPGLSVALALLASAAAQRVGAGISPGEACGGASVSAGRLCREAAEQAAPDLLSACCTAVAQLDSVGCFCLVADDPRSASGLAFSFSGEDSIVSDLQGIPELAVEACGVQVGLPGTAACEAAVVGSAAASSSDALSAVRWNFAELPPGARIVPAQGSEGLDGIVTPSEGPYAVQFGGRGPGGGEDGAASFDGVMAHVQVPYSPLLNPASISVRAVVQPRPPDVDPRVVPGGDTPQGVATSWSSSGLGGWSLERQSVPGGAFDAEESRWNFALSTPTGVFKLMSEEPALDGAWYDIVGTYDPQTKKAALYVNGESATTTQVLPSSMIGNPDGPLWLAGGGRPLVVDATGALVSGVEYSRPFSGLMSEVEIFNVALDPGVVRGLHRELTARSPATGATAFGVVPVPKKTSGALPAWAIAIIACGFVALAAALTVGLFAYRRTFPKTPRDVSARTNQWRKARSASHASNMAAALPKANAEPGTPQAGDAIPPGMPKFEKVGSRVTVSWVDPTDAIADGNNLNDNDNDLTVPLSPKTHAVGFHSYRPGE